MPSDEMVRRVSDVLEVFGHSRELRDDIATRALTAAGVDEMAERLAMAEGETRVLIGCPCRCHDGSTYRDPHLDCRECVRGSATYGYWYTPQQIDADHEWALWHEKWAAALDLMSSQAERAAAAEAERDALQQRVRELGAALEVADIGIEGLRAQLAGLRELLSDIDNAPGALTHISDAIYVRLRAALAKLPTEERK